MRGQPFVLSTTARGTLADVNVLAVKASLFVAAFPLAIAALLIWWRLGR
jgi:hypothetical protein